MTRLKYPLTPQAMQIASELVHCWDEGWLDQSFELSDKTAGSDNIREFIFSVGVFAGDKLPILRLGTIRELAEYKLIGIREKISSDKAFTRSLEITLLQELRNAVNNDFEVSDFFLTVTAIGTIIHGDVSGSTIQGSASIYGGTVNIIQLTSQVEELVGEEILQANQDLRFAINELRQSIKDPEPTRFQKLGKVIEELGRCLGHVSNTYGVLQAIALLSEVAKKL